MTVNVYAHNPNTEEVTFPSGTVVFEGGTGYIANFITDDGRFLGEATGPTRLEARYALQEQLLASLQEVTTDMDTIHEARERIALSRSIRRPVSLENMPDGELGHLIRETLRQSIVMSATEHREAALMDKELLKAEEDRLRVQERATRDSIPHSGYTAYGVTVPALDLSDVDMNMVADEQTMDVYSALSVLAGRGPLDRETTTYGQIASLHFTLRPASGDGIAVVLTAGQMAKVQTIVEIMGVSEAEAVELVLA